MEAVDLNFRCLSILNEAGEEKSPVLLIHGMRGSLFSWEGVSEVIALRTGRKVCAVDLRNHGDSPYTPEFDVEVLTADIEQFLHKANIEKVNIIGHSLGGKIGIHYALKNPGKTESLIVEDIRPNETTETALKLAREYNKLLQQAIDSVPEGADEQEARKILGNFINSKLQEIGIKEILDDKKVEAFQIRLVDNKWQWKVNMDVLNKVLEDPAESFGESKGVYEGPTLFIYGTKSPFDVGGDEANIKRLFPNVKMIPVEGANHQIHRLFKEFEEEVIKLLNSL